VLNLSFSSPLMPTVKGTKLLTAGINLPRIIENIPYLRTICLLFLIFFSLDYSGKVNTSSEKLGTLNSWHEWTRKA
jgi:hypothetical protein